MYSPLRVEKEERVQSRSIGRINKCIDVNGERNVNIGTYGDGRKV